MRAADILRLALGNLRENPLRTALCALSVAVGTGALLLIASIGLFGRAQVGETLQTLGVSGLTVYVDGASAGETLSAALANRMEQAVAQIETVMPIKACGGAIRAGYASESAVFLGADERLGDVMQLEVLYGSLLTARDAQSVSPAAVIGDDLARLLYGRTNIVGRAVQVQVDGCEREFTICGVVRAQTGALGGVVSAIAPHLVYIPYTCLAEPTESADQVFVQCAADADLTEVSGRIEQYLTGRGRVGGTVRVQNMSGLVRSVERLADLGTLLFAAVGAVTLVVALIGVMCSMLAAAREKTGEIGVLLALGAQPRDIRRLFLMQSALLCAVGGVIGLTAAGLLLRAVSALLVPGGGLTAALLLLAILCGTLAGLLPAVRAARLDPIDAIRK